MDTKAENEKPKELATDVAAKYQLRRNAPIEGYYPGYGELKLYELNVQQADGLFEKKFKWLELKPAKQEKTPDSTKIPKG